jgi:cysteine desulfurase / selenocysteine lyase
MVRQWCQSGSIRSMSEAGGGGKALDSRAVRKLFPYLEEVTYLNTATTGLSWLGQGAAAARFYDQHKSRGYSAHLQWRGELERTRELLARLLRVPAEEVSFVSSATEALNGVAHGIALQPGDEVVLCEDEFPSIVLAWTPTALRGAELVRVPIDREESRTDALIERITDRTRVVAVSHVHWGTGTRVDLDRIAAAARKVGARFIVDGAHAVGAIDVDASVADLYTGSVFKWLLSAFGVAYVVTKGSFAAEIAPLFRGYANEPPSRKLQYSHPNYPALYALSATLEFLGGLGWQPILEQVSSLTGFLHRELRREGWVVVTPEDARAGIVSVAHDEATQTVARLLEQDIEIEERAGLLRISPHFYNSQGDLCRLLDALGRNPSLTR